MELLEQIKEKIKKLSDFGIPIFMLRDPVKKAPSVSLTMMFIAFNLCLFSLINKFAKIVQGVDVENSIQLFLITAGLYFSRSFTNGKHKLDIEKKEDK